MVKNYQLIKNNMNNFGDFGIENLIDKERDRIWSEIEEWCLDHDVERDEYLARIIFDKSVGIV